MLGIKKGGKETYEEMELRIEELNGINRSLKEEITRLKQLLLDQKPSDCEIGPWCYDCVHVGYDSAINCIWDGFDSKITVEGKTFFCKKKLHSCCKSFEPSQSVIEQTKYRIRKERIES